MGSEWYLAIKLDSAKDGMIEPWVTPKVFDTLEAATLEQTKRGNNHYQNEYLVVTNPYWAPKTTEAPTDPNYYKNLKPEPIDVIKSWGLNFNLGCAVKYIVRAGKKDPAKHAEDIFRAHEGSVEDFCELSLR